MSLNDLVSDGETYYQLEDSRVVVGFDWTNRYKIAPTQIPYDARGAPAPYTSKMSLPLGI